ncbi:MAG TPA: DMT family transporter [Candidatus Dormibacteraeota bacterium]
MSPALLLLILVAAVFHAAWNALLKASEGPLALAARATSYGTLVALPVVAVVWLLQGRPGMPLAVWPVVISSAVLELLYFIALTSAYERGELSLVYPIARGTAPLLAVLVGLLLLREQVGGWALGGVILLLAGIWLIRRPTPASAAVVPALITGVLIAAYSSVDRVGVRLTSPWLYGWFLWFFEALLLLGYTRVRRVARARLSVEPRRSLLVGVLMTATYFMILFALSVAPLAVVAPVRESAIVLVTAWGIWRLRERRGAWLRFAGALAIVGGIALVAMG